MKNRLTALCDLVKSFSQFKVTSGYGSELEDFLANSRTAKEQVFLTYKGFSPNIIKENLSVIYDHYFTLYVVTQRDIEEVTLEFINGFLADGVACDYGNYGILINSGSYDENAGVLTLVLQLIEG